MTDNTVDFQCGDKALNPTSLGKAKDEAIGLVHGEPGDGLRCPSGWLNVMQAALRLRCIE